MSLHQGSCLRVDLSSQEISRGLTPENLLFSGIGPLSGTEFAATCRFIASAKSPLTGFLGDSGARGFFAPELQWAGVSQIIPIPDGPAKGTTIDIHRLVDDYYEVKGWKD